MTKLKYHFFISQNVLKIHPLPISISPYKLTQSGNKYIRIYMYKMILADSFNHISIHEYLNTMSNFPTFNVSTYFRRV